MIHIGDRLRAFGRSWILTTLGLYDDSELAVADTEPCPPPDADPESAPPVPAPGDDSDEWLVIGRPRVKG
jgi:hypothetical protein